MQKPKTYQGDLANLPPALAPLTHEPRWLNWKWEWHDRKNGGGKWTKPPYQARHPNRHARSDDPTTWGNHADAVGTVTSGDADGIGFALLGSNIGAVDLDHCRDSKTGEIAPWADTIISGANGAYCEITVSGNGLRIIGQASGPETHRRITIDRDSGAGFEIYRNCARYITVSGLEIGHCAELSKPDDFFDHLRDSSGATAPAGGLDFNNAGQQQSSIDYDEVIANGVPEGQRSEAFQAVVWHLAGKGCSSEQINDELARHPNGIGAKYADRLYAEIERSFQKWCNAKRAAATGAEAPPNAQNAWPRIFVRSGELPRVVNEAEDALLLLGREIFQRGGMVVRPVLSKLKAADDRQTEGWRLIQVTKPYLVESLTCAARFLRYDARSKDWTPTDAPDRVAEAYLNRQGKWQLPILAGITNVPFLRHDGSICEQPGYDPQSGLLFKPDHNITFPAIPQQPSKADAEQALRLIDSLIETFPFVTPADRAVALSAVLTTLDRRSMATAPLHGFTAPAAGTGKSLLVDLSAMLASGRRMPVISQGRTEEELEKRLGAALLAGDLAISLDNCEHPLQSTFLCQALTQQQLNIRLLGLSRNVETPVNATVFATGNNLEVIGDLTRRTLMCALDAHCEHPERRHFTVDPITRARIERPRLVVAALTVLRAWHVAGETVRRPPLGNFEDWSYRIRAPLIWLGRADPCATTLEVQTNDPRLLTLQVVMAQWRQNIGLAQGKTIQQVIGLAVNTTDFHVALQNVAHSRNGNLVSNDRLGRWLKKVEGRVVDGLTFRCVGRVDGYPTWSLIEV